MGRTITDEQVSEHYAMIVNARTGVEAFKLLQNTSRTMLAKLADLTHAPEGDGPTAIIDYVFRDAGWSDPTRGAVPDGHGPCASGFSAHSRRPLECRHCKRHADDHRVVSFDS